MLGGIKKYPYLCSAKKERDGLCHQRTKTLAGHRALSEFAKKETLRIVPQQFLTIKRDTVQLTYPISSSDKELSRLYFSIMSLSRFSSWTVFRILFFIILYLLVLWFD